MGTEPMPLVLGCWEGPSCAGSLRSRARRARRVRQARRVRRARRARRARRYRSQDSPARAQRSRPSRCRAPRAVLRNSDTKDADTVQAVRQRLLTTHPTRQSYRTGPGACWDTMPARSDGAAREAARSCGQEAYRFQCTRGVAARPRARSRRQQQHPRRQLRQQAPARRPRHSLTRVPR